MSMNPFASYSRWLHTQWPAGTVEKLPLVREDGACNVPGVYIVGDLTGIPLLKFSLDTGTRAIRAISDDPKFQRLRDGSAKSPDGVNGGGATDSDSGDGIVDVAIVGGGCAGMAAALEAKKRGLSFVVLETNRPFSTIVNFPARKPIFLYPDEMTPAGDLSATANVKEALVEELERQTKAAGLKTREGRAERIRRVGELLHVELAPGGQIPGGQTPDDPIRARRVIVAIGRTGNYRTLGVPGEELDKVSNRLHDPKDFAGRKVVVVGGGDSALEAAIALAESGADVTLSYRKTEFSRAKSENSEKIFRLAAGTSSDTENSSDTGNSAQRLRLVMGSTMGEITPESVVLKIKQGEETIENDAVLTLIGREAPLEFFRRSGIKISGEGTTFGWALLVVFLVFCVWMYGWKSGASWETSLDPWPGNMPELIAGIGGGSGEEVIQDVGPTFGPQVGAQVGAQVGTDVRSTGWLAASVADRSTMIGTFAVSMKSRSFYYTLAYSLCVVVFGIARMRRRRTPYVRVQTSVLMAIQVIPLFLLPELILPWMGYNGWFDAGWGRAVADRLFELYIPVDQYLAGAWPEWGIRARIGAPTDSFSPGR